MEYLTLQDIPHRHCNPVHSHRMASQSSERPVGHMAAVCDTSSSPSDTYSSPPYILLPPHEPLVCYDFASRIDSIERAAVLARRSPSPQSLREITLPTILPSPLVLPPPEHQLAGVGPFLGALEADMDISKHGVPISATRACSPESRDRYKSWRNTKNLLQSHLQRSSPPLQPGEQIFPGKLPSFDEVSIIQMILQSYDADSSSSFRQPSRGHRHTPPREGMTPQKTPHMSVPNLMM